MFYAQGTGTPDDMFIDIPVGNQDANTAPNCIISCIFVAVAGFPAGNTLCIGGGPGGGTPCIAGTATITPVAHVIANVCIEPASVLPPESDL